MVAVPPVAQKKLLHTKPLAQSALASQNSPAPPLHNPFWQKNPVGHGLDEEHGRLSASSSIATNITIIIRITTITTTKAIRIPTQGSTI
jgi:hypothetical protein